AIGRIRPVMDELVKAFREQHHVSEEYAREQIPSLLDIPEHTVGGARNPAAITAKQVTAAWMKFVESDQTFKLLEQRAGEERFAHARETWWRMWQGGGQISTEDRRMSQKMKEIIEDTRYTEGTQDITPDKARELFGKGGLRSHEEQLISGKTGMSPADVHRLYPLVAGTPEVFQEMLGGKPDEIGPMRMGQPHFSFNSPTELTHYMQTHSGSHMDVAETTANATTSMDKKMDTLIAAVKENHPSNGKPSTGHGIGVWSAHGIGL